MTASKKVCANCSRPLEAQPRAAHKRFCCNSCRQSWHGAQRALAGSLQAALDSRDPGQDEGLYDRIARVAGVEREAVKRIVQALCAGGVQGS